MWALLVFTYIVMMQVVGMVPKLGRFFVLVLIPVFSASFMVFSRELDQGNRLGLGLLFSGFRTNFPALLKQGGLYLASVLIVLGLSALADGGVLLKVIAFGEMPPVAAVEDGSFARAMALLGVLYIPVLASFWFAPALSAWRNLPATQALFYSFFAAFRNWKAFLAYGLAMSLAGFMLSLTFVVVVVLLQGLLGIRSQNTFIVVQLLVMLTYVPTLFASFYASYCDVFAPRESAAENAADAQ